MVPLIRLLGEAETIRIHMLESVVGYRIFALCIRQVLNNWQMTIRISGFWILAILASASLVTGAIAGFGSMADGPVASGLPILFILLGLAWFVLAVFGFCTVAIAWHRYVLRNEMPSTFYVTQRGWPIGGYFWKTVKIVLLFFLIVMVFIVLPVLLLGMPNLLKFLGLTDLGEPTGPLSFVVLFVLPVIYSSFGLWIFLRFGTVLPAVAVGKQMSLAESYRLTRPVAGQLFLTAVMITLFQSIPSVIQLLMASGFGPDVNVVSILFYAIIVVFAWINFFVSIGVLTVVYGHLQEERPI